jgi:hypothetical protein
VNGDVVPSVIGIVLVAAAAAFVLVPFARGARAESSSPSEEPSVDRFGIYRQVLELEFDHQLGKLSTADFEALSGELLARAGEALQQERGRLSAIDEQIEREIAAARAAFVAARVSAQQEAIR